MAVFITKEEWIRRYAARIGEVTNSAPEHCLECANVAAATIEQEHKAQGCTPVWYGVRCGSQVSPEEDADEEMSNWSDDEGADLD